VLQCVYSWKQDWCTSVQKNLCQFVLYHVGDCVNLYQFGKGFLLMNGFCKTSFVERPNSWIHELVVNTYEFCYTMLYYTPFRLQWSNKTFSTSAWLVAIVVSSNSVPKCLFLLPIFINGSCKMWDTLQGYFTWRDQMGASPNLPHSFQ
jgi:hypothetical protein